MSTFNKIRRVAVLALVAGGMSWGTQAALADSCYVGGGAPRPTYARVVTYVTKHIPYTTWIVKYDHCGVPYKVPHTSYRTVRVPVEQVVLVD